MHKLGTKKSSKSAGELTLDEQKVMLNEDMVFAESPIAAFSSAFPVPSESSEEGAVSGEDEDDIALGDFVFQLLDDVFPVESGRDEPGSDMGEVLERRYKDQRLLLQEFHTQGRTSQEMLLLTEMLKNGFPGLNNDGQASSTDVFREHDGAVTLLRDALDIIRGGAIPVNERDTLKKVITVIHTTSNALTLSSSAIQASNVWLREPAEGSQPVSDVAHQAFEKRFQDAKNNIDTCSLAELVSGLQNPKLGEPVAQAESASTPERASNDNDVVVWARVEEARRAIKAARKLANACISPWKIGSQVMKSIHTELESLAAPLQSIEKELGKRKEDITKNSKDWESQINNMKKPWGFSSSDYDALSNNILSMAEALDILQEKSPISPHFGRTVKVIRLLFLVSMQVNFTTPTMLMWMMKLHNALETAVATMTSAELTLSGGRGEPQGTISSGTPETDNNLLMLSVLAWPDAESANIAFDNTINKVSHCAHVINEVDDSYKNLIASLTAHLENVRSDIQTHLSPKPYTFIDELPEIFSDIINQEPQHRLKNAVNIHLAFSRIFKDNANKTKNNTRIMNRVEFSMVTQLIETLTDALLTLDEVMQPVMDNAAGAGLGSSNKILQAVTQKIKHILDYYNSEKVRRGKSRLFNAIKLQVPNRQRPTLTMHMAVLTYAKRMQGCISEIITEEGGTSKTGQQSNVTDNAVIIGMGFLALPTLVDNFKSKLQKSKIAASTKLTPRNSAGVDEEDMREWNDMAALLMPIYHAMRDNLDAMENCQNALKLKAQYVRHDGEGKENIYGDNARQSLKSAKENVIKTQRNVAGTSGTLTAPEHQGLIYGTDYNMESFVNKIQEQLSIFERASSEYSVALSSQKTEDMNQAIDCASKARTHIDNLILQSSPLTKLNRYTPKEKIAQHLGGLIADWKTEHADLSNVEAQQIIDDFIETHIRPDYDTDSDHSMRIRVKQAYETAREGTAASPPPTQEAVLQSMGNFSNYLARLGARAGARRMVTSAMRGTLGGLLSLTWMKLVINLLLKNAFLLVEIRSSLHALSKTAQIGQTGLENAEWKALSLILKKYAFRLGKSMLPLLGKLAVEAALITYTLSRDDRLKNLAAGFRPSALASSAGFSLPGVMLSLYVKHRKEKAIKEIEKIIAELDIAMSTVSTSLQAKEEWNSSLDTPLSDEEPVAPEQMQENSLVDNLDEESSEQKMQKTRIIQKEIERVDDGFINKNIKEPRTIDSHEGTRIIVKRDAIGNKEFEKFLRMRNHSIDTLRRKTLEDERKKAAAEYDDKNQKTSMPEHNVSSVYAENDLNLNDTPKLLLKRYLVALYKKYKMDPNRIERDYIAVEPYAHDTNHIFELMKITPGTLATNNVGVEIQKKYGATSSVSGALFGHRVHYPDDYPQGLKDELEKGSFLEEMKEKLKVKLNTPEWVTARKENLRNRAAFSLMIHNHDNLTPEEIDRRLDRAKPFMYRGSKVPGMFIIQDEFNDKKGRLYSLRSGFTPIDIEHFEIIKYKPLIEMGINLGSHDIRNKPDELIKNLSVDRYIFRDENENKIEDFLFDAEKNKLYQGLDSTTVTSWEEYLRNGLQAVKFSLLIVGPQLGPTGGMVAGMLDVLAIAVQARITDDPNLANIYIEEAFWSVLGETIGASFLKKSPKLSTQESKQVKNIMSEVISSSGTVKEKLKKFKGKIDTLVDKKKKSIQNSTGHTGIGKNNVPESSLGKTEPSQFTKKAGEPDIVQSAGSYMKETVTEFNQVHHIHNYDNKFKTWLPNNKNEMPNKFVLSAHGNSIGKTVSAPEDKIFYFYNEYGKVLKDQGLTSSYNKPLGRVRYNNTEVPDGKGGWRGASPEEMKKLTGTTEPGKFKDMSLSHYERDNPAAALDTWSVKNKGDLTPAPDAETGIITVPASAKGSTELSTIAKHLNGNVHTPVEIHVQACRETRWGYLRHPLTNRQGTKSPNKLSNMFPEQSLELAQRSKQQYVGQDINRLSNIYNRHSRIRQSSIGEDFAASLPPGPGLGMPIFLRFKEYLQKKQNKRAFEAYKVIRREERRARRAQNVPPQRTDVWTENSRSKRQTAHIAEKMPGDDGLGIFGILRLTRLLTHEIAEEEGSVNSQYHPWHRSRDSLDYMIQRMSSFSLRNMNEAQDGIFGKDVRIKHTDIGWIVFFLHDFSTKATPEEWQFLHTTGKIPVSYQGTVPDVFKRISLSQLYTFIAYQEEREINPDALITDIDMMPDQDLNEFITDTNTQQVDGVFERLVKHLTELREAFKSNVDAPQEELKIIQDYFFGENNHINSDDIDKIINFLNNFQKEATEDGWQQLERNGQFPTHFSSKMPHVFKRISLQALDKFFAFMSTKNSDPNSFNKGYRIILDKKRS